MRCLERWEKSKVDPNIMANPSRCTSMFGNHQGTMPMGFQVNGTIILVALIPAPIPNTHIHITFNHHKILPSLGGPRCIPLEFDCWKSGFISKKLWSGRTYLAPGAWPKSGNCFWAFTSCGSRRLAQEAISRQWLRKTFASGCALFRASIKCAHFCTTSTIATVANPCVVAFLSSPLSVWQRKSLSSFSQNANATAIMSFFYTTVSSISIHSM